MSEEFLRGMGLFHDGDAIRYLRTVRIASQPHPTAQFAPPGVHRFRVIQETTGINFVRDPDAPQGNWQSFEAYWCPNIGKAAPTVAVGARAMIFLTPVLTGCVLEINGDEVRHHDGYARSRDGAAGLPRGGKSGRRHWENGDYYASAVIGARIGGRWRFYQQSTNPGDPFPLPLGRVTEI